MSSEYNIEAAKAYREKHGFVTVSHDKRGDYENEANLKVSHNGSQSIVISLSEKEAKEVIRLLTEHFKLETKEYEVLLNGTVVSAREVQEILGTDKGKCQFMLLPNGELRLRVFTVENKYSFFPLSDRQGFSVRPKQIS
jgi:siroheme synthase